MKFPTETRLAEIVRGLAVASLGVCLLLGNEWLFCATKMSFMVSLQPRESLLALVASVCTSIAALSGAALLAAILSLVPGCGRAAVWLWVGTAAMPYLGFLVLLVDNFTYVLFGITVKALVGFQLWAYRGGALLALIWLIRKSASRSRTQWFRSPSRRKCAACAAPMAILAGCLWGYRERAREIPAPVERSVVTSPNTSLPNIVILSSDGVESARMSVYGYARNTTPYLLRHQSEWFIVENAFANAPTTASSLVSLMTGKTLLTLRYTEPPAIVRGKSSYEHLPGLLRALGYRTADIGYRQHADLSDSNLLDAIDEPLTLRTVPRASRLTLHLAPSLPSAAAYFLNQTIDRLLERHSRLTGLEKHPSLLGLPTLLHGLDHLFLLPKEAAVYPLLDEERVRRLLDFVRRTKGARRTPFFVHAHFMNTHGPTYRSTFSPFASAHAQATLWNEDGYDNAIVSFDRVVTDVVQQLRSLALLESTLIVVTSDHGRHWGTSRRLPLLFRFPGGKYSGRTSTPAQRIDIAPTLLGRLAVAPPPWMEGNDLLRGPINPFRQISGATFSPHFRRVSERVYEPELDSPFLGLEEIQTIECNRVLSLDLWSGALRESLIEDYVGPCPEQLLTSLDERARSLRRTARQTFESRTPVTNDDRSCRTPTWIIATVP